MTGTATAPGAACPTTGTWLDFGLLARLLDAADETETPRALLRRARARSLTLPPLLLSALAARHEPLGSGSGDELRRARRRAAVYADISGWAAELGVRTLKGPSLARRYPEPLQRPVGDLDLVAPGEGVLWEVVRRLYARYPVDAVQLSVLRADDERQLLVGLYWPDEDPLLDRSLNVEITTFALAGDGAAVPSRVAVPADQGLADLLALADERFQREFGIKDWLDAALVLTAPSPPDPAALVRWAREYRIAPELLELVTQTGERTGLAPLLPGAALRGLRDTARRERERRARRTAGPRRPATGVDGRYRAGLPVYGFALEEIRPREGGGRTAEWRTHAGAPVLRTPIGHFLLVGGASVAPEQYAAARAAITTTEESGR
ncbi:hypothetical protein ACGFZL_12995 [Streptomyces sp. NPDC048182]|uniref:hypothetical protein n=1 Tax=unclassified Streptomyces TaxID=2593676 RepID=UPI0033B3286C